MLFEEEFRGLPSEIKGALLLRVEEIVRLIARRVNTSHRDPDIRHYTKEELAGMFHGVFDLAEKLKTKFDTDH